MKKKLIISAILCTSLISSNIALVRANDLSWQLHTGTSLEEAGGNFAFDAADFNNDGKTDIYAIKKSGTGSKSTEVHILDGGNYYTSFLFQSGTPLEEANENFQFAIGDYNQDGKPDIYALKTSGTGSKNTEVHILNGANNYQSFSLHAGTPLEEANKNFKFAIGDYNQDGKPDIYAIKTSGTGSGSTEIHILNGADNYQSFLLHTGTPLEEGGTVFDFCAGDYNGDGKTDIYAIKKSGTVSKSTEFHILDGANNYQSFITQRGTPLEEANNNFSFCIGDYNNDGADDLYALKTSGTGSGCTEVHIMSIDSQASQNIDIADGIYYMIPKCETGCTLDVSGGSSNNGANIQIWTKNGSNAQKFEIKRNSNGYYTIKNIQSGKCLDVQGGSNAIGTNVWQYEYNGSDAQQWKITKNSNGFYRLQPKNSLNQSLDVDNTKGSGSNVHIYLNNDNVAQQWTFEAASSGSISSATGTLTNALYNINISESKITCGFDGYVNTKGRHEGIDFQYGIGKSIYSLTDGVVTRVSNGYNGSNGLSTIAIYNSEKNKTIIYLHTAPSSLYVGQTIKRGQLIATEAWRGISSSKSSHTHVEVRNGRQTSAAKSVNDYTLDNSNPTSFWNSLGYIVK